MGRVRMSRGAGEPTTLWLHAGYKFFFGDIILCTVAPKKTKRQLVNNRQQKGLL